MPKKPLGRKAYGSIPHLPGSRRGEGDHGVNDGQAAIAFGKVRDKHDRVYVQEKLDGSNVAVTLIDDQIIPLGRSGYRAETSPYLQHQVFSDWVFANQERFRELLNPGEWVSGEWLAQAHGTRYKLQHEPFVGFDIFTATGERLLLDKCLARLRRVNIIPPSLLPYGFSDGVMSLGEPTIEAIIGYLDNKSLIPALRGALDPIEGGVWRIERKDKVDFLCKYVRPDKVDGKYLPGCNGNGETIVWNEGIEHYLPKKALDRLQQNGYFV